MSRIPILCYHNVGAVPAASRFPLLYMTPDKLARQLWMIRRLGLRGVSMSEGMPQLCSSARSNLVILTFDDGFVDTVTDALPILREYGCTATCYLVSDAIGKYNSWDHELRRETKALMTRQQVDQWLAAGMEIGSHSCSHPRLQALDAEAAQGEISASRAALRALFDASIDHFAYPYGGFTEVTVELVKRAGYRSAVGVALGVAGPMDDPYRLPRVLVNGERAWWRLLPRIARAYGASRYRIHSA
jgi:peptidoglycan/xylan/chitin deacetylase (PgdA/CDA1 family)